MACLHPLTSTETRCFIVLTALLHCFFVCLSLQMVEGHCMWSVSEKGRAMVCTGEGRGQGPCVCGGGAVGDACV